MKGKPKDRRENSRPDNLTPVLSPVLGEMRIQFDKRRILLTVSS